MSETKRKGFLWMDEWADLTADFTFEQKGKLLTAAQAYSMGEACEVELDKEVKVAYRFITKCIDHHNAKYEEICQKRADAGKRGRNKQLEQMQANAGNCPQMPPNANYQNQNQNQNQHPIIKGCGNGAHAPAREEVEKFFLDNSATIEQAERFFNYWEAAGWIRGATPLKAWEASARQWILEDYRKKLQQPKTQVNGRNKGTAGCEIAAAEDYTSEF